MKLIDTSGWIEYFRGTALGGDYAAHIAEAEVLVPAIVVYEVYKVICRDEGEEAAIRAVSRLRREQLAGVDDMLAVLAADLALRHSLAMADAIIYATALAYEAEVVTSDADLGNLPNVVYLPKAASGLSDG